MLAIRLAALAAVTVLGCSTPSAGGPRHPEPATHRPTAVLDAPSHAAPLAEVLVSPAGAPELGEASKLYGQFVGDWEVDVTNHKPDGTSETVRGEWRFGWILEGRAIQDVFRVPARDGPARPLLAYGTTVRVPDLRRNTWTVVYFGAVTGTALQLTARKEGSEIVQEGVDGSGRPSRWIFSDMERDAFRWRAVSSPDGGHTWELEQEMSARRKRVP